MGEKHQKLGARRQELTPEAPTLWLWALGALSSENIATISDPMFLNYEISSKFPKTPIFRALMIPN